MGESDFKSNVSRNGKESNMSTPQVHTPRPTPQFFQESNTFSTKKARNGTPRDCPPPRPPVKSAPPVSRVFSHRKVTKAVPVSFRSSPEQTILSPCYNEGSKVLYFDQCFDVDSLLGCGSFGEVFKVRSKEDGKMYAVKRSVEKFKGESDKKRKVQEVAKHEKLPSHPNLVGFVKAWEEKQHLYIQTELCQKSLQKVADQNHDMTEKLIWKYMVDLLMAVNHLHDHDLVHMDIKPENIFIAEDGNACKLGDFGLVLDVSTGADFSEAQEGDPKYLAPELMLGKFGKPADIFSLGLTILELASDLDLPRGGDPWHQLRTGQLPEEFLLGVSEDLRKIIRWMMEPDPEKRPTVKQVLAHPHVSQLVGKRTPESLPKSGPNRNAPSPNIAARCLSFRKAKNIHQVRKRQRDIRSMGVRPDGLETPPPPRLKERRTTPNRKNTIDWEDHSFSDDDMEGISINNNSMGMPLDTSNSSMSGEEGSSKDASGFAVPTLPNKAATTPGIRPRHLNCTDPDSPIVASKASFYSSSPVGTPISTHLEPPRTFSPPEEPIPSTSSSNGHSPDVEMAEVKVGIEPKNLMDAFLCASSDDDDDDV